MLIHPFLLGPLEGQNVLSFDGKGTELCSLSNSEIESAFTRCVGVSKSDRTTSSRVASLSVGFESNSPSNPHVFPGAISERHVFFCFALRYAGPDFQSSTFICDRVIDFLSFLQIPVGDVHMPSWGTACILSYGGIQLSSALPIL